MLHYWFSSLRLLKLTTNETSLYEEIKKNYNEKKYRRWKLENE